MCSISSNTFWSAVRRLGSENPLLWSSNPVDASTGCVGWGDAYPGGRTANLTAAALTTTNTKIVPFIQFLFLSEWFSRQTKIVILLTGVNILSGDTRELVSASIPLTASEGNRWRF
jgi:hypothetical protein